MSRPPNVARESDIKLTLGGASGCGFTERVANNAREKAPVSYMEE